MNLAMFVTDMLSYYREAGYDLETASELTVADALKVINAENSHVLEGIIKN